MHMSFKKIAALAVSLLVAVNAASAAEPAGGKKENLFAWTPTVGGATVRAPFTTRYPQRGHMATVGDNQQSAVAGFKILAKGGNAFDAAVAMAAVTSMTYPSMNNLFGGDAMIIVYSAKDKKVITYNGTGWAPKAATIDKYIEMGGIPFSGINSVEIPGSFAGWMAVLRDYGTMKLADIFEPAIDLGENGYSLSQMMALRGKGALKFLNETGKAVYAPNGEHLGYGDKVLNLDYAKTLRELSGMSYQEAEDYVYRGPIAKEIVEFSKSLGGMIEYEDFADFRAEKVEAHSTNFHGIDVYVCPPNSQGWVLLEALNLLEGYDLKSLGHNSAAYIDVLTQALNLALDDRNSFMADPRFHKNPMAMIRKPYAETRRKAMHPGRAMEDVIPHGSAADTESFGDVYFGKGKDGDTTFFAVVDKEGNIVATTTSLCNLYGSGLMVPGRGIVLNNRMTYFFLDTEMPNYLEPHKRTIQTITPSIALKDGKPYLVFGTPGADVQEQAKLQVFLNYAVWGMDPQEAVEAPRFQSRHPVTIMGHNTYPRTLQIEGRIPQAVRDELKDQYGYVIQSKGDWEYIGYMNAIGFDEKNGFCSAAAEPRSDAYAVAW